jgi:hypothetical protein
VENSTDNERVIEWEGKELIVHEFRKSHANGGRLEKFWVEDRKSGREFLIKGASRFSYEPFSEKIAYLVGKNLGMDVLEYDIIPAKYFKGMIPMNPLCKYVSICERIDKQGYSITSVAEIKRALNAVKDDDEPYVSNKEVMLDIMGKRDVETMILFDAIIGNTDRHYGNVHILRNKKGEMVAAPILDNGASLLAQNKIIWALLGYNIGKFFNRSSNMENTQEKQILHIDLTEKGLSTHDKRIADIGIGGISYNIVPKTIDILNDIQPTLDKMPKIRANMIKKYLVYRLHRYLTIVKQGKMPEKDTSSSSKVVGSREKEHT